MTAKIIGLLCAFFFIIFQDTLLSERLHRVNYDTAEMVFFSCMTSHEVEVEREGLT